MKFELVEIVTKDKLVHQGIFYAPVKSSKKAILWVHGLTGRFYGDVALMNLFARECKKTNMGFAAFNNRGHDYLAGAHRVDPRNDDEYVYETVGASSENFTDCIFDIDAALSFLTEKGFTQVTLVGHSTGANKACYYAGTTDDARIAGVVLVGSMSDRYGSDQEASKKHEVVMRQKIQEGKGDELMVGYDYFPLTPTRWLSLMTQGSAEDVFNYKDSRGALKTYQKINRPLLVIFSGKDEHADSPIEQIRKAFDRHAKTKSYKSIIVAGADHGFTGKEKEFVSTVVDWTASL